LQDRFLPVNVFGKVEGVTYLISISEKTLLIGALGGVFRFDLHAGLSSGRLTRLKTPKGITCGVMQGGDILWGTEKDGCFVMSAFNLDAPYQRLADIPFSNIVSLTIDLNNGLWLVGPESLASFKSGFFEQIDLSQADLPVDCLHESQHGDLYV